MAEKLTPEPNYPHVPQLNAEPRPINLYGIAGWATSWHTPRQVENAIGFGGYFAYDPENSSISGEMIDVHGPSKVKGVMNEEKLVFDKTYVRPDGTAKHTVSYDFDKTGDTWRGGFVLEDRVGDAECATTLIHEDAYYMVKGGPPSFREPTYLHPQDTYMRILESSDEPVDDEPPF